MAYDTMSGQQYVLGDNPEELVRLDRQAAAIERPTRLLLQTAGLTAGMRVLDLGTGLGHVARLAGEIVGPSGSVLGIDRSEEMLAVARQRTEATSARHVTFAIGDATAWRAVEPFDAVVARLLLFHVVDPTAVVRHQLQNLRPGGAFIAVDFDLGATRAEPAVPIVVEAMRWIEEAFHAVGAWPRVGTRLGPILRREGLERVGTFGIQPYVPPHDATSATMLASVIRRLGPVIVQHRIATAEQIDPATLEQRIAGAVRAADAVVMLPTVVGAWGFAPGS